MANKTIKRIALIAVTSYTLLLLYGMLFAFGRPRLAEEGYRYNLIPFKTIGHFIAIVPFHPATSFVNLAGNIVLFVPYGVLLPLLAAYPLGRWLALYSLGICTVELMQLVTKRGMLDIDDLILNVVGFLLGCVLLGWLRQSRLSRA